MAFAFMHLIFPWTISKLSKINLSRYQWFFLLFGAIFPDVDYLFDWTFGFHIHRTITHSLFMIVLGFFIIYLGCYFFDKELNGKNLGTLFSLGILSHLILDMIFGHPGIGLLWPLDYRFWFFGFLDSYTNLSLSELPISILIWKIKLAILDMGLGVLWIGYLFFKGKIKEF